MVKQNRKFNSQLPINKIYKKFSSDICDNNMTFHDCEIEILRHSVEESEKLSGSKIANSDEVKDLLKIVEDFIIRKKLICYGGTAINNILPKFSQFYNRDIEIPDYDFYSMNALEDAKELADIYYKNGYIDVEAKAGVHRGTFKVFVNYIPIADITFLNSGVYKSIMKEAIIIAGIHYAPPNFLRMAMYLELSRPLGDVSRWEKVFKRLSLLNKHYPLKTTKNCSAIDFGKKIDKNSSESEKIHTIAKDSFIDQGVVFFGGYAATLYSKYLPDNEVNFLKKIPNFDILSEEPDKCATILKETLTRENYKNIKLIEHPEIGEIIPMHVEVTVNSETLAYIYKPIACHSYNKITVNNKEVKVATIDTILTFYLSFLYINNKYYNKDRLLCMAKLLFEIENRNRLSQKGLLKRFSLDCYGKQLTLEDIRSEKAKKYKELSSERGSKEYNMWFLKYEPIKKNQTNMNKEEIEKSILEEPEKRMMKIQKPKIDRKKNKKTKKIPTLLRILQKKSNTRKNKSSNFLF
uniref:Poly(A) polymerase catalytic subunit domain-containing protein n=1 Tax=viral metagenome TaxID=1070528 RepID=A0A6C0JE60_9ZZZZ